MGAFTPATPLRADLGHWLGGLTTPAPPARPPPVGASPQIELKHLKARILELEAGPAPSTPGGDAGTKRKEPTPVVRMGVATDGGKKFQLGKKVFDLVALAERLTEMGVDPTHRCPQWLLCHGEGTGRARAECPDYALHSAGGDWHKPVPKLKTSEFDVSRTPEERAAIKERGAAARAGKRAPAGARPGKGAA